MTEENKAKVRKVIEEEGWNRFGLIDPNPPFSVWNKVVEIMYEDMDGQPCTCKAIYFAKAFGQNYFKATNGAAKGNRIAKVFAWKEIENECKDNM